MYRVFVLKTTNYDYKGDKIRKYVVLDEQENNYSTIYYYREVAEADQENREFIKPYNFKYIDAKSINIFEEIKRELRNNYSTYSTRVNEFEEIESSPEKEKLYIPKKYEAKDIKMEMEIDENISDDLLEKIKKINSTYPVVIINEKVPEKEYEENEKYSKRVSLDKQDTYEYFCTKCKNTYFTKDMWNCSCPTCNTTRRRKTPILVMEELKNHRKTEFKDSYYVDFDKPIKNIERIYYMCSKDNGIVIYKIMKEIIAKKYKVTEKYAIEYSIEHIPGKNITTYKHLKKGKKECSSFEALNLNSKNIQKIPQILYENDDNFFEFIQKNEKFLQMSGFQAVLKYSSEPLVLEKFFIIFIAIMNKYPIMEQIVKMGHAQIFWRLYDGIMKSNSAAEINENVEKISQIVNTEATKGKEALRFPSYIGDYLIKKNASLDEYYYWRDLYEISNLSKEQFENFIDSFNFAWVNSQVGLEDVGNILKFGYQVDKLFAYIVKQSRTYNILIKDIIQMMTDYLNMCDFCDIQADKFPQDLKKQHDDMLIYFSKREKIEYDKKLTVIGAECEKYVIPNEDELDNIGIPKLFKTTTVVFPRCEADFINEGNQQHNCVGSYPRHVRNGDCIIFFIRNKENPDKSFITAECTRRGLGQCFYSNNRAVNDENLIKFAKYIANKIKTGCSSGKIHGLNNI